MADRNLPGWRAADQVRLDSCSLSIPLSKPALPTTTRRSEVIGTLRGARGGYAPGHYMLDAWRGRVEVRRSQAEVVALHETWRSNAVLVEDAGAGQSLIQELRAGTTLPLKPIKVERTKLSAPLPSARCSRRAVCSCPRVAWWRDDFSAELTSFLGQRLRRLGSTPSCRRSIYLREPSAGPTGSLWPSSRLRRAGCVWRHVGRPAAVEAELSTAELENGSPARRQSLGLSGT